jgi:hypothetical protein
LRRLAQRAAGVGALRRGERRAVELTLIRRNRAGAPTAQEETEEGGEDKNVPNHSQRNWIPHCR